MIDIKASKRILTAFILNAVFSVVELIGGALTGSTAILSDAVHDMGDAVSIGASYFLERKSLKPADGKYTYGYKRLSVLGGALTTLILFAGSVAVTVNAVKKIINPTPTDYDGMIILALIGVAVNLTAAYFTGGGESLNQRAVNLHMLEDVLGWLAVLVGAIVMRFTQLHFIDPLISIVISAFMLVAAAKNLKAAVELFLEKAPDGISADEIKHKLCEINGVDDVHHIHIWSTDGIDNYVTLHLVTDEDAEKIKKQVRHKLEHCGIHHVTIELEKIGEDCDEKSCRIIGELHHPVCCHHHSH